MTDRENIVEGLTPLEPQPDVSFGELIYQHLLKHEGHDVALIDGYSRRKVTYNEMIRQTCSLAQALRNNGCGKNTIIGICSKNNIRFLYPALSALYIGATPTLLNFDYTVGELQKVLNLSKPNIVFCSEHLVDTFYELKKNLDFIHKIIVIDSGESSNKAQCLKDFIEESLDGVWISSVVTASVDIQNHLAFIMNSSGTTGMSKGVMVTHKNMNALFMHFKDSRIYDQESVSMCASPLFHAYGLCISIFGVMIKGSSVIFSDFEIHAFLKAIEAYKVRRLFLVPPLAVFLSKSHLIEDYDLSSISEIISAAAPLKESTEREIKRRLYLKTSRQAYGLTETTFAVTISGKDEQWKPGSSGKLGPYMRFVIRDPITGHFLGPNESGEVCFKGDLVMKGYYNNPDETKASFTEDGWFLTGDIGYYDEDHDLYITDRIKELIKFNGFQVPPAELEALLLTHSEIQDCGIIGLPDERAGELPLAFVVKTQGSSLEVEDVQNFVRSKLSQQKWLRGGVIFVNEIPKTGSGKILRRKLRILAQEILIPKGQ